LKFAFESNAPSARTLFTSLFPSPTYSDETSMETTCPVLLSTVRFCPECGFHPRGFAPFTTV